MFLLFLFLLTGTYGFSLHQQCKTDQECSQPNTYCYQNRICANCTNCSLYNRQPSSGCAREKHQCGECLPGVDKEVNIDKTFTCSIPSDKTPPNTEAPDEQNWKYIISVAVLLMLIMSIAIIVYKRKQLWEFIKSCYINKQMSTPENSKDPPPYTVSPTAPLEEASPPIYQKVYHHVENNPNQTANAYSNPQYVQGGDLGHNPEQEEQEEQEDSEGDALLTTSVSHPDDEETQPSNWTPTTTRSETGSITGPTTFEAAFNNLQQLTISQPDMTNQQIQAYRTNSHPNFQYTSQTSNSDTSSDTNNPQVHNQIGPVNISINLNMSK